MSLEPVIALQQVSKSYNGKRVLDNVTYTVPPGVVFALLGENGAGKTTTIQVLLGLASADRGTASVLGLDSNRSGLEIRRRVGYMSERPPLDEWMTVGETGWFAAGFYGDDFQKRFEQSMERFEIPLKQRIKQLSKGTRSKVALSLALAHDPQLLILDEPTSGLDAAVRRDVLESMVDFTADGKTVFLSSHQIHEVERVADMVAILHEGKLVACGPLDELKQNTTEVQLTFAHEDITFELPPEVISCRRRGRQCQLFVECDAQEVGRVLSNVPATEQWETRKPSLEDIFLAYIQAHPAPTDSPISVVSSPKGVSPS